MEQQTDISDQTLDKLIIRAAGNTEHPVAKEDVDDLVSALIELKGRREYEKGAPFMSMAGDWALGIFIAVVLIISGYYAWEIYW